MIIGLSNALLTLARSLNVIKSEITTFIDEGSEPALLLRDIDREEGQLEFLIEIINVLYGDRLHWKTEIKLTKLATEAAELKSLLQALSSQLEFNQRLLESNNQESHGIEYLNDEIAKTAHMFQQSGRYYASKQSADHEIAPLMKSFPPDGSGFKVLHREELVHFSSLPNEDESQEHTIVPVFFATDRNLAKNNNKSRAKFKNGRGKESLDYGISEVSIPPRHKKGKLERPLKIWKFEFKENPEKHIVITDCKVKALSEWKQLAVEQLNEMESSSALVYIHGFNTDFDGAIRQAAQIGFDIEFNGMIMAYSWSSEASPSPRAYSADEESVQLTEPLLHDFLLMLNKDLNVSTIHVLAHSMGNRAIVGAIKGFSNSVASYNGSLKDVIFAAPDIDAAVFKGDMKKIVGRANRYTLYGSNCDTALAISKSMRKGCPPRAGDGGINVVVTPGVETVDASAAGRDMLGLGHAYFSSRYTLLNDIHSLISQSLPASNRFGLRQKSQNKLVYWEFMPSN